MKTPVSEFEFSPRVGEWLSKLTVNYGPRKTIRILALDPHHIYSNMWCQSWPVEVRDPEFAEEIREDASRFYDACCTA